jgi:hypothetical protein
MEDTKAAERHEPSDPAPATQVIGNRTPERIRHALAHSARIHRILEDQPDHKSRAQMEELLANYKAFLSGVDAETMAAIRRDVTGIHDMTPELVAKAVSHLEG